MAVGGQGHAAPAREGSGMKTDRPELQSGILPTSRTLINFSDLQIPILQNRKDAICLCTALGFCEDSVQASAHSFRNAYQTSIKCQALSYVLGKHFEQR